MKAKLDTWINFKTTKEQKAQIKLWADVGEISQSEFIRDAIDILIGGCEATRKSKGDKTYNFALTKGEIRLLILSLVCNAPKVPEVQKLYGIFVRALESIEKGGSE